MYPVYLLSVLLRCNGFTGIQNAVLGAAGSRSPNRDHALFLSLSLALGSVLKFLLGPNYWPGCH